MVEQTPPTGIWLRLARVGENAYYLGANMVDTVLYPVGLSFTEEVPVPPQTAHQVMGAEAPTAAGSMQTIPQFNNPEGVSPVAQTTNAQIADLLKQTALGAPIAEVDSPSGLFSPMLLGLAFVALLCAVIGYYMHKKYRSQDGMSYNPLSDRQAKQNQNNNNDFPLPQDVYNVVDAPAAKTNVWGAEEKKQEEKVGEVADLESFKIEPLQAPVEPVTITHESVNKAIADQKVNADPEEEQFTISDYAFEYATTAATAREKEEKEKANLKPVGEFGAGLVGHAPLTKIISSDKDNDVKESLTSLGGNEPNGSSFQPPGLN